MATFPVPVDTGIAVEFKVSADWVGGAEGRNPLELVGALVEGFSLAFSDVAAAAQGQIVRAQFNIRNEQESSLVAEAIGLGLRDGEIVTRINIDALGEYLQRAETLPFSLEFDWEFPVLQIQAGGETVTISVTALDLREGSLIAKLPSIVTGPILLALFTVGASIAATEGIEAWERHQAIGIVIGKSPCRIAYNFRIDAGDIHRLAAEQLNWEHPPEGVAKNLVVCRLQYALRLADEYPGPIDGVWGTQTEAALRRFMTKQGLEHHPLNSAAVLGQLALVASKARIAPPG